MTSGARLDKDIFTVSAVVFLRSGCVYWQGETVNSLYLFDNQDSMEQNQRISITIEKKSVFIPASLAVIFAGQLLDDRGTICNVPKEACLVCGDEGDENKQADKDHDGSDPHAVLPDHSDKLVRRE